MIQCYHAVIVPFYLGTRIVERVRRSLSRSSVGRSSTGHNTDNESVTGSNIVSENDKSVKSYKTVEMRPSSAPEKVSLFAV